MLIKLSDIKINPDYKSLVPRVSIEEYATMKESIKTHGIREPIVINKEKIIIDGHTRYQIAIELGKNEIPTREETYPNPYLEKKAVIEYNLHRRQLNTAQKCELGLSWLAIETQEAEERKIKEIEATKPKSNQKGFQPKSVEVVKLLHPLESPKIATESTFKHNSDNRIVVEIPTNEPYIEVHKPVETGKAIEKAAEKVGVSASTLQHYKKMSDAAKTNPGLQKEKEQALNGTKSVNKVFNSAKQIEKREEKKEMLKNRPLPEDKFEVIYADPPWEYEFSETEKRSLDNQYPQMKLEDICKLPINTTDDAVLFLWTTSPKLEEGLKVLKAWGFTYKTNAVWIKDKIGMGYYFRQRHELLLIGVKGKIGVPDPANRPNSVIESPRTEHSKKPDCYEMIEKMYPYRKYIELFARNNRKGWECWGNEPLPK